MMRSVVGADEDGHGCAIRVSARRRHRDWSREPVPSGNVGNPLPLGRLQMNNNEILFLDY